MQVLLQAVNHLRAPLGAVPAKTLEIRENLTNYSCRDLAPGVKCPRKLIEDVAFPPLQPSLVSMVPREHSPDFHGDIQELRAIGIVQQHDQFLVPGDALDH